MRAACQKVLFRERKKKKKVFKNSRTFDDALLFLFLIRGWLVGCTVGGITAGGALGTSLSIQPTKEFFSTQKILPRAKRNFPSSEKLSFLLSDFFIFRFSHKVYLLTTFPHISLFDPSHLVFNRERKSLDFCPLSPHSFRS